MYEQTEIQKEEALEEARENLNRILATDLPEYYQGTVEAA